MASDTRLTNLTEVKEELKFGDPSAVHEYDGWLNRLIDRASAAVRDLADRWFIMSSVTEWHTFDGQSSKLFLSEWPVRVDTPTSTLKVYEDSNRVYDAASLLVEGEDYFVDYERGIITRVSGSAPYPFEYGMAAIKVEYFGGYDDALNTKVNIPKPVRDLAVQAVVAGYRRVEARHRGERVQDESGKKISSKDPGIEIPMTVDCGKLVGVYTRLQATLTRSRVTRTPV